MAELVDAPGSGSGGRTPVRVQIPLAAHFTKLKFSQSYLKTH